ncbi:MAG: heme o synthase [Myxococcota bacterium]
MSQVEAPRTLLAEFTRDEPTALRGLLEIVRPKVIGLVVFTGLPALVLGQQTWPSATQAFFVLLGTALIGGACSAFNAVIERDSDARMARTRQRPLPAAAMSPSMVTTYGVVLTLVGSVVLYAAGSALAVAIGLGTIAFYVGVYTAWLKPRTPQNIVIGGAAGSTAPLIASAAVGDGISAGAVILFLIVFLWTPPHFWAIAIFRKREYELAGFPMMPSVVGNRATRWRSLGYAALLLPVTLAPVGLGQLSWGYGAVAVVVGVGFLVSMARSIVLDRPPVDRQVFRHSIVHLSLLFGAMLVDLVGQRMLE